MLIGVVFYSFTIGNIAILITEINLKGVHYNNTLDEFEDIVIESKLPRVLKSKVFRFFQTNYSQNHLWGINKKDIFLDLPINMKQKIILLVYSDLIERVNFFKINLTFTAEILEECLFIKCRNQDVIYRFNDPAEEVFILV